MNSEELEKKVYQIIDSNKDEIAQTLSKLVQIPSLAGGEGKAQKYMQELFSKLPGAKVISFEADFDKVSQHPAFNDTGHGFKNRPNVLAILEGDATAKSVKLTGHVDVVPCEEETDWTYSPWSGKIVGNKLYGRGSSDMKAGLIAQYFALKSLLDAGIKPKGTVTLESVIDEEIQGGGGMLTCLIEGYRADGFIITEPVWEEITVSYGGVHWFRVKLTGKPAHAARAHTGINAITEMNKIYEALLKLDKKRGREIHYPLFERGAGRPTNLNEKGEARSTNLNIGKYRAGDWPSTVAGWAEMECRVGSIPGEKTEDVKKQVEDTIKEAARNDEWLREHPPVVEWFGLRCEPWEQDPNHPFVQAFKKCADRVLETDVEFAGGPSAGDSHYTNYFDHQPTIYFGPRGFSGHGVDECVELDSIIRCVKVFSSFIMEWCGIKD